MMDWFKWLSSTNLDPSLVHQYGILFTNNELQDEDIPFFNHEFLQSMGITIAKHRLEILKLLPPPLQTKGTKSSTALAPVRLPMSKVFVAAKNTKKNFTKYMLKSWTKQRVDESKALALTIVPDSSDDSSGSIDHNHHGSRLSRGLTMLKRSKQRNVQPSKSAATTPESYYYPKKQQHSISPIYASTPRIRSFCSSPTFRVDCLQMADRMNYGHHVDVDLDDGYWSAGVEETKWDTMFHNLKPT